MGHAGKEVAWSTCSPSRLFVNATNEKMHRNVLKTNTEAPDSEGFIDGWESVE
jgi:hypothetical protein